MHMDEICGRPTVWRGNGSQAEVKGQRLMN